MFTDRKRILYVDDDEMACDMMQELLGSDNDGFDIMAVSSVDAALKWIRDGRFNLYLLDYCLPVRTGAELCSMIRRFDQHTPVLIYSALSRQIDRRRAMEAGADHFLVKPDDMDELQRTVRQLLAVPHDTGSFARRPARRATNIL